MSEIIERKFKLGTVDRQGVFIEARIDDKGELHITGSIHRSGHDVGGGQCIDEAWRVIVRGTLLIDRVQASKLIRVWRRWHLNHMRAGCSHQQAVGWDKFPLDPEKPTSAYGIHFAGQRSSSWNMRTWVRKDEHPLGLMCEPCWICGYKYGTAWLKEELPESIREFIANLPGDPIEAMTIEGRRLRDARYATSLA